MSLKNKTEEIKRLIAAFEVESAKFYPLNFSLFFITQDGASSDRLFSRPNHAIMLWQYYGSLGQPGAIDDFMKKAKWEKK